MKIPRVSIVTVTRNRALLLAECLGSLVLQSVQPDEIIIIDNNSTDSTAEIAKSFAQNVKFPVKRLLEKRVGYPMVYNRGLRVATYNWVAFIDDDCVADPKWLEEIKNKIVKNNSVAALVGHSLTCYPQNIYALATYLFDQSWKANNLEGEKVINFEILDNKNIVYSKEFLTSHGISFDEKRVTSHNGAAEDADLGLQIQVNKGRAIYLEKMLVRHKDPVTWSQFFKKRFSSFAAYLEFQKKWGAPTIKAKKNTRLRKLISNIFHNYPSSLMFRFRWVSLVSFTVLLSLFINFVLQSSRVKEFYIKRF